MNTNISILLIYSVSLSVFPYNFFFSIQLLIGINGSIANYNNLKLDHLIFKSFI